MIPLMDTKDMALGPLINWLWSSDRFIELIKSKCVMLGSLVLTTVNWPL